MTTARLPHAPARNTPLEVIAERIEEDLDRLRRHRPILDARIDRAARIVVVQLSSPPAARPIKCRVRRGGRRVLLVASLSAGGAVYQVDPHDWTCSCPDFHRKAKGCKHGIAAWALWRSSLPSEVGEHMDRIEEINDRIHHEDDDDDEGEWSGCGACHGAGWVFLDEDVIDSKTGEVGKATNPVRCRSCSPVEPPYLSDEELAEWMASTRWRYAKTMPAHPHDYSLREWNDEETFLRVVQTIWERGFDRIYLRRPWRSLDIGDHYVWIAGAPPKPGDPAPVETTALINRALRVQERLGVGT
ncbi:MAG: SWIM zinc finger family protein [Rubrobacteraceae bacterium]